MVIAGVSVLGYDDVMLSWFRNRRRRRVTQRPFPPEWAEILGRNAPWMQRLEPDDRAELYSKIQIFVAEKNFEGRGGLEMTDEIRVTIAAHACRLLLGGASDCYPKLFSIIVYPSTYVAPKRERGPGGTVVETMQARLGESWTSGAIVLSWDDVRHGIADIHDGHNVVYHEFAHQLDAEYGGTDGAPKLSRPSMYVTWARVFSQEYETLVRSVLEGRETLLDAYGATNPAEFFAVATEFFFERPVELKARHPELYEQLAAYFRRDPAAHCS
jgi:Mlc titration factor MtfA (ptsG expression regulator)